MQPISGTLSMEIKKQAREYFNKEYHEIRHIVKQLLEKYKVFPRVIKVLMDKVCGMHAVSFNDLQNIWMFAFSPNDLKSIADVTGKDDMDFIVVPTPQLPSINTFRRDPAYPKVESVPPTHNFLYKEPSEHEPEGSLGHLVMTKPETHNKVTLMIGSNQPPPHVST